MTYISNIVRSTGDPKVLRSGPSSLGASDRLGRALGWFSVGLGLVEILAPGRIPRKLGMEGNEDLHLPAAPNLAAVSHRPATG